MDALNLQAVVTYAQCRQLPGWRDEGHGRAVCVADPRIHFDHGWLVIPSDDGKTNWGYSGENMPRLDWLLKVKRHGMKKAPLPPGRGQRTKEFHRGCCDSHAPLP